MAESAIGKFHRGGRLLREAELRDSIGRFPGEFTRESGLTGPELIGCACLTPVSAYAMNASQRRRLWATATRSITLVILASPRTLNWLRGCEFFGFCCC